MKAAEENGPSKNRRRIRESFHKATDEGQRRVTDKANHPYSFEVRKRGKDTSLRLMNKQRMPFVFQRGRKEEEYRSSI